VLWSFLNPYVLIGGEYLYQWAWRDIYRFRELAYLASCSPTDEADGARGYLIQQSDMLNHVGRSIYRLDSSRYQDIVLSFGSSQCPSTASLVAEGSHFLRFRRKTISIDAKYEQHEE
jgi:hypothetical protein